MADEKDDKWVMPKPVFRSSPGSLPKSLQKTISGYNLPRSPMPVAPDPDDDILSVMSPAAPATPMAADGDTPPSSDGAGKAVPASVPEPQDVTATESSADTAVTPLPERPPSVKVAARPAAAGKKGGAGSFILIFLLITAVAAGLVYGVIYYLSHRAGTGG
jgi:hypothetical protein